MVISSLDPARQTYLLWHRFSMPTVHGARDAISVPADVADQLNSAYTFMVQMIVLSFWTLLILAGVVLFLGTEKHSHNSGVICTGIWNAKAPTSVLSLTAAYFTKIKDRRRWQLLLWTILALGFVIASYAVPIKVAPYIIIDHAAPVSAKAIYVPSLSTSEILSTSQTNAVQVNAIEAPSAFRALGSVQVANSTLRAKISIDPPLTIQDLGDGEAIIRVGYRYNITGVDFGLQHYPDLHLSVEGSCQTDYSWLVAESVDASGLILDEYLPFNDPITQYTQNVSLYDSARPLAYFFVQPPSPTDLPGNLTWGAVVSSVQRQSFSPSKDPWYLTVPNGANNLVKGGRPALSCWQNDVWSYHGHQSSVIELNSTALPGLDLSLPLQNIFARFLSVPKITTLATRLGASALLSTSTALGETFDAGSSSFHADLERLVFASYIATMNTLTDTTLFPTNNYGILNDVLNSDGSVPPGVDDFVIWSSHVRTLSVLALIIVPVMALVMFLIVYTLTNLPFSWYRIQALQATVLYSCLHEKSLGNNTTGDLQRDERPFVKTGDLEQAMFRPRFDKASRTLSWGAAEYRAVTLGIPTPMSPKPIDEDERSSRTTAFPFPPPTQMETENEKLMPGGHKSNRPVVTFASDPDEREG